MAKLVPNQAACRAAIDKRFPKRDRGSDGWIADKHHRPPSEHIPDRNGLVRAIDIDVDGIHRPSVVAGMILHPSTWYVISNRRIMSRARGFRPKVYTGPNPHTGHAHRSSLISESADRSTARYRLLDGTTGARWGLLRKGADGHATRELQALLIGWGYTLTLDGDFGDATDAALRRFQVARKVPHSVRGGKGDGVAGRHTRAVLLGIRL